MIKESWSSVLFLKRVDFCCFCSYIEFILVLTESFCVKESFSNMSAPINLTRSCSGNEMCNFRLLKKSF